MACQRRAICSVKFVTGLVCGAVIGFLMGSIHLAVMNSQMIYVPGSENPCDGAGAALSIGQRDIHRGRSAGPGLDSDIAKLLKYNEMESDRKRLDDRDDYTDLEEDIDIESMLDDREIDKIYEIDSSKLEQLRWHENKDLSENFSPRKSKRPKTRKEVDKDELNDDAQLLYIGVMTAGKYVPTRGKAIMDTWAVNIPGKVELFVGEEAIIDGTDNLDKMNVVRLKKVDDNAYPPQKKSFMMLKYMHDHYLNGYEWFMRADDDVYIKPDKLEKLLRKLNSSEPIFIGQMGFGNEQERGKLTLYHGENYCMGGPGMIFSREVIRRIAPNIGTCLGNMYTTHEDVEVSRCVNKFADVNCVWSYEMRELFYEHYSKRLGYIDPADVSLGNELNAAITLHPNKKPEYQRILHTHFLSEKIKHLQDKLSKLYRDVIVEDEALGRTPDPEEFMLGVPLSLNRYRPTNGNNIVPWHFFSDILFSPSREMPRRGIPTHMKLAAKDIILQTLGMMNKNANVKGRMISYKRINYAYFRVNPIFGTEYVLDLLLHYTRYRGKKVTLPVRRHAYLQQTFGRTELHEDPKTDLSKLFTAELRLENKGAFKSAIEKVLLNPFRYIFFGKKSTQSDNNKPDTMIRIPDWVRSSRRVDSKFNAFSDGRSTLPTVNIIVPLAGRFSTFQRFMANLETIALSKSEPIAILIMLFVPSDGRQRQDMRRTQQLISDYNNRYPSYDIRSLPVAGEFSRGLALEVGASQFSEDSLLFFCDVDVVFNSEFLRKCRSNTVRGETVYYPILFSEFDPSGGSSNVESMERKNHYEIGSDDGYWRGFGYGLLCVYQSDFMSTGGFDTSIKGWGLEDVDLFGKFLQQDTEEDSEKTTTAVTAKPFRVTEPDLIHVYHPSHCDSKLESKQFAMCRSSRSSSIMSVSNLHKKWLEENNDGEYEYDRDRPLLHQNAARLLAGKGRIFYKAGNEK